MEIWNHKETLIDVAIHKELFFNCCFIHELILPIVNSQLYHSELIQFLAIIYKFWTMV